MSNKKISQLNVNSNPTPSDAFAIVNSGETKQISLSAVTEYVNFKSLANLGFIIRPRPINQDVTLPENSEVLYFDLLEMGNGSTLSIPNTTIIKIKTE